MTPWEIQGSELFNCNCSYGCPCQFNALPTHGFCEAVGGVAIERGHHGSTRLDGLKIAGAFQWPGPIHEGGGVVQLVVDERADAAQREALLRIAAGEDTEPFATIFAVFASVTETVHPPIFAPIEYVVDVDARIGVVRVPGVLDVKGEPIRNPVDGSEHRVRIDLPNGFEYEIAEIGSASSRSQGKVSISIKDSYAQFARLHMNQSGIIRHRKAA